MGIFLQILRFSSHPLRHLVLMSALLWMIAPAAWAAPQPSVLLLNSYNAGLSWTDDITTGVRNTLRAQNQAINLQVEYLDSKRHPEAEYLEQYIDQFFSYKLQHSHFDLLIVSDNDAFNFALRHRNGLLAGKPIVFCGVNGFDPRQIEGLPDITGIAEAPELKANIELIRKFHPATSELVIIGSTQDATGQRNYAAFTQLEKQYPQLKFTYLNDLVMEDLVPQLATLHPGQVAFTSLTIKDRQGRFYGFAEATQRLREVLPVPLYGAWDFFLGHGIVGGKLINGQIQGAEAAKMAVAILNGQKAGDLPVLSSIGTSYMFDNRELKRFGISLDQLPQPNTIVHGDISVYEVDKRLFWSTLGFIVLLALLSLFLMHQISLRRSSERSLLSSRARFRDIAISMGDWIWEIDSQGTYCYCSEKVFDLLGFTPQEVLGKTFFDFMENEQAESTRKLLFQNQQNGTAFKDHEAWVSHKNGTPVCLSNSGVPIFNAQGTCLGYRGVTKDISLRKFAEQEIIWRRAEFAAIIDAIDDALIYVDPQRQAVMINPAFTRIFGYELKDLRGKTSSFLYADPEDFTRQGQVRFSPQADPVTTRFNAEYRRKDGSTFPGEAMGSHVVSETGELLGYLGIIRDITERKRLEEERALIIENSPVPMAIVDEHDHVLLINQKHSQLLGYSLEEIPDVETWHRLAYPDENYRRKVALDWQRIRTAAYNEKLEFTGVVREVTDKSGKKHTIELNGRALGKLLILSMVDMTSRLDMEKQLRQAHKMEAIGTMAGGIAHDFNNLLSIISGNIELVQRKLSQNKPIEDHIDNIKSASLRAKNLVSQILAFSRQDKHQLSQVDLGQNINEALKLLRSTLPTTVELLQNISDRPLVIRADTTQLQQVMFNLCANALHAMNEKGQLEIRLDEMVKTPQDLNEPPQLEPGRYARLVVADTGVGMDRDTLARAFDPFFTTKKTGVGTGMGLSVVHGIVKNHGGQIDIDSTPGQGTSVTIYFPLINITEHTAAREQLSPHDIFAGEGRILLVDDEELLVHATCELLEDLGYSVTATTSSPQALELFRTNPMGYDLVISDQTMPKLSGSELALELLKIRSDLPIILCSGYSAQISEIEARRLGVREFLPKPFEMPILAAMLQKLLKNSS
jgi:PAS domain S-box-containing protein